MKAALICSFIILNPFSFLTKGEILKFLDETPEIIRDEATVKDDWEHVEGLLKSLVNGGVKTLLPLLIESMQSSNISATCIKDSMKILAGIRRLKPWAMRFIDSTAKGLDGVLSLTSAFYGAYDECIDTVTDSQRSGKHYSETLFTGKYCLLHIKPHLPPMKPRYKVGEILKSLKGIYERDTILSKVARYAPSFHHVSLRLGLCVPSGCSVKDINQILSKAANYTRLYMKVKHCEVKEHPKYTTVMIVTLTVYSFAGLMVLLGTLTDAYFYYSKRESLSIPVRILFTFSLLSNFKKLVNTSTSVKSLRCLSGIRFLTLSWVIVGHSYLLLIFQYASTLELLDYWNQNLLFQVVMNGFLSVDTFFFLGGFLVCYNGVKHVILQKKQFSIVMYILHRMWRILPSYAFVILFVFILQLVTSGPTSHKAFRAVLEGCESNWWTNLLFINNFYGPTERCLEHTWYIAVDMQLYIASLIILIPLFRWPKVGLSIAVITLVVSMIISGAIACTKNLTPTLLFLSSGNAQDVRNYITEYYFKPYPHIGPYIVGILTGYFLVMKPDVKIPKVVQLVGWSCAIVFSTSTVYGARDWNAGREASFWEIAFYTGCHKVAWTLSIAWMVICCITGHGGIINHILSWKVWIPLARLTFMAYLVHYLVQICFIASLRTTIYPAQSIMVWMIFGHLMASYGTAFVGCMLIESPMMALEKIIWPQSHAKMMNNTGNNTKNTVNLKGITNKKDKNMSSGELNISTFVTCTENAVFVHKL